MEITGKIIHDLPEASGTSKSGSEWKKKEYVLETNDQYPRKVHFGFFGERCDQYRLQVGQDVTISFDIESREFNGRWYTDIRAWKAEAKEVATPAPTAAPAPTATPKAPEAPKFDASLFANARPQPQGEVDALPF